MKTPARIALERAQREAFERSMYQQLTRYLQIGGLDWRPQYEFLSDRKYRADFAELNHRLLVEVQGGSWIPGSHSHTGGTGYDHDCVRMAEASIAGWSMIYVTADMITDGRALRLVERWFQARRGIANGNQANL
jgi:very-short-patch-repair endonuclease